jgi:hypothetical protein
MACERPIEPIAHDVDFCWRVLAAGYELGFHPAAFVWHHRRFSYGAYFRQQMGYGRAEALLMPIHPDRFRGAGGAIWRGQVYASRGLRGGSFVYHGRYGYEPFQMIYPDGDTGLSEVALHVLWWIGIAGLAIGGLFVPSLFIAVAVMIALLLYAFVQPGERLAMRGQHQRIGGKRFVFIQRIQIELQGIAVGFVIEHADVG